MTELGQRPISMPPWEPPPNRRRQVFRVVAALLVVILLGGGIGSVVYVHHYQPLESGSYGGRFGNVATVTDGIDETAFIATGPTGSVSSLLVSIRNSGHFDVRLLGLEADAFGMIHGSVRWLPITPKEGVTPTDPRWTAHSVTLHPGQEAGVELDVVRPNCPANGGYGDIEQIPIRWSALGVHHLFYLPLSGWSARPIGLYLCYPKAALQHLAR